MRVILHGITDDIGHLIETAVIEGLHRVKYAALHGLEAVLYMRHGTLEYHVGGVLEEPASVHTAQMVCQRVAVDDRRCGDVVQVAYISA